MLHNPILVTGGAGFLGSNIIKKLNELDISDIIIIDNYNARKFENIKNLSFLDYISYDNSINYIKGEINRYNVKTIVHVGANADVLVTDPKIMLEHNYEHSKFYLDLAIDNNIPFIYASSSAVYGNSGQDLNIYKLENPHNIYAWSKWLFDKYVTAKFPILKNRVIGLRLFNIFGIGEFHKGKNASIPYRFFSFLKDKGFIDVYDRQIERDYVWVEDIANIVVEILNDDTINNGIYDVGGNNPISHKELANLVTTAFIEKGIMNEKDQLIKIVPMPDDVTNSFQFYTKANKLIPLVSKYTNGNRAKIRNYIDQLLNLFYASSKV